MIRNSFHSIYIPSTVNTNLNYTLVKFARSLDENLHRNQHIRMAEKYFNCEVSSLRYFSWSYLHFKHSCHVKSEKKKRKYISCPFRYVNKLNFRAKRWQSYLQMGFHPIVSITSWTFCFKRKFNSMCKYVSTIIVTAKHFATLNTQSENFHSLYFLSPTCMVFPSGCSSAVIIIFLKRDLMRSIKTKAIYLLESNTQ